MSDLSTSDYVGNYKVLAKFNEGGMALIYKALQPALKRTVILKKLKDPNREIIKRFKKEALLSASFHHENLLAIYDFLYTNRSYYLVMEYVDGEDLRTLIDYLAPFPAEVAALVILDIARALEYTHMRNIIHRDIKPGNILLSFEGDVKLIDFGVAKDEISTRLTMTGMIVGTPAYMSPEQANGAQLTVQSDLFSLGILLYEMLTGVKPFWGENNTEILSKLIRNKYVPAQRINPEIPRPLRHIIHRALRNDARRRYHQATEMIHDLERFLPWQLRSRKKEIVARFVEKLNKAQSSGAPSASAFVSPSGYPAKLWNGLKTGLAVAVVALMGFQAYYFNGNHLGYLQLNASPLPGRLRIDHQRIKSVTQAGILFGPLLSGGHTLHYTDPTTGNTAIVSVRIQANDTSATHIELPQTALPAALEITSQPAGLQVYVDQTAVGLTPVHNLNIVSGRHQIRFVHDGQTLQTQSLALQGNRFYHIHFIR